MTIPEFQSPEITLVLIDGVQRRLAALEAENAALTALDRSTMNAAEIADAMARRTILGMAIDEVIAEIAALGRG